MISRNNDQSGECFSPTARPIFDQGNSQNACSSSNLSRSSAVSVCSSGNLSSTSGSKCMVVVVLPGCRKHNTVEVVVDLKSRIENVLNQVAVLIGLVDVEFFGLAVKTTVPDDEFRFLELESKIQSLFHRDILTGLRRSASGLFRKHARNFAENTTVTLHLRTVCYVDNPAVIQDAVALQLYFDQLRENTLEYGQLIVPETCFTLAALALQADEQPIPYSAFFNGKHQASSDDTSALSSSASKLPNDVLNLYVPDWMIRNQGASFVSLQLPRLQQELSEMSRVEAQLMYCRYASQRPFHHNLHVYGIKRKKTDSYFTLWLGIGFRGLDVFEDVEGRFKKIIGAFEWASIAKIQTNGKSLDMRVVGGKHKYTYWTDTEERAANLLRLIRLAHQLQLQLTRTTDSRLQITPAFRQDFPTIRRVLQTPHQENSSPKVEAVKTNVQDQTQPLKQTAQSSVPGTPGWAPSRLDRQPAGEGSPASKPSNAHNIESRFAHSSTDASMHRDGKQLENKNMENKVVFASPSTQPKSNGRYSSSDPSSPIVKCVSLDMLNEQTNGPSTSRDSAQKRLGANSESHLVEMTTGPIVPVRL